MAFDPDIHPEYRRNDAYLNKESMLDITPMDVIQSALLYVQHHSDIIRDVVVIFRVDPLADKKGMKHLSLYKDNTTTMIDLLGLMAFARMSMERDFNRDFPNGQSCEEEDDE